MGKRIQRTYEFHLLRSKRFFRCRSRTPDRPLGTQRREVVLPGNDFVLHLAMRFKPAFAGRKIIETSVADEGKLTTGWQPVGWWDVPN